MWPAALTYALANAEQREALIQSPRHQRDARSRAGRVRRTRRWSGNDV
jgi:hypothetical protein